MNKSEIKTELKSLIDQETDLGFLEDMKALFERESMEASIENEMISRVLKSERDIRKGRVFTFEEAEVRLNKKLGF